MPVVLIATKVVSSNISGGIITLTNSTSFYTSGITFYNASGSRSFNLRIGGATGNLGSDRSILFNAQDTNTNITLPSTGALS